MSGEGASEVTGTAMMSVGEQRFKVEYRFPLYSVVGRGSNITHLGTTPDHMKQNNWGDKSRFDGHQDQHYFALYHHISGNHNGEYIISTHTRNSDIFWARMNVEFPEFSYSQTKLSLPANR